MTRILISVTRLLATPRNLVGFFILLMMSNCTNELPDPEVTASFTATGSGATVNFSNRSQFASRYSWDFGDGTYSDEESPTHIYSQPGIYTVVLVVWGKNNVSDRMSLAVTVGWNGSTPGTTTGGSTGKHTFWFQDNPKVGAVNVYVNGNLAGTINNYHNNGITCGSGDVNYENKAGTYSWTAKGQSGGSWSGSFTLTENQCQATKLIPPTTTSSNAGTYSFWTKSDLGFGNISITVGGSYVGSISHYHYNGVTCGSADVNVSKTPGTYSWTAKGTTGGSWSGNIIIEAGKCGRMELTR